MSWYLKRETHKYIPFQELLADFNTMLPSRLQVVTDEFKAMEMRVAAAETTVKHQGDEIATLVARLQSKCIIAWRILVIIKNGTWNYKMGMSY